MQDEPSTDTQPRPSTWLRQIVWTAALVCVALALHFLPQMWADRLVTTMRHPPPRFENRRSDDPLITTASPSLPPVTTNSAPIPASSATPPADSPLPREDSIFLSEPTATQETNRQTDTHPLAPSPADSLRGKIIQSLTTVIDPELRVNLVDMGMIREVTLDGDKGVTITMILTSPICPYFKTLLLGIRSAVAGIYPALHVSIVIDHETQWTPDHLTPQGRTLMGIDRW